MTTFIDYFEVDPNQSIDFLNLKLERDTKIFLDPYSVAMTNNIHCINAHKCIKAFMEVLLSALKNDDQKLATELCSYFHEPKGTGIVCTCLMFISTVRNFSTIHIIILFPELNA